MYWCEPNASPQLITLSRPRHLGLSLVKVELKIRGDNDYIIYVCKHDLENDHRMQGEAAICWLTDNIYIYIRILLYSPK